MDINSYRSELPHISEGTVHLNHAGVSAISTCVVNSMRNAISSFSSGDPGWFVSGRAQFEMCRSRLASLLGVDPINLAITKNTAHGISIVADGLNWKDGDEVIFADCEYPANTYPWLAQQDRGVVCKVVPTEPNGTVPVESYRKAITSRTRLIAVSWVQFSTGYRNDLAALTELAHKHNAQILVDVIQGLGALPIDLNALGVDFAATGSQKWLLGPMGVGGLYVHPNALNDLRLVNMGAGSVNNVFTFEPLNFDTKNNAQRYEEGTPNYFGVLGLEAALSMLQDAGASNVETSIRDVTSYAVERLEQSGYIVVSPKAWDERAGIVLFRHSSIPNSAIMESLAKSKVIVVERAGKIRFAPHFYNNSEDIDRAINALPKG